MECQDKMDKIDSHPWVAVNMIIVQYNNSNNLTGYWFVTILSQRKVDTYRQVQFIPSNDTTSLEVYLPSDVTLTHATPTATSQTPPLPSTPNIPNQPSTPPHGRMPGTFSPEPTPR